MTTPVSPNQLGPSLERFFREYLISLRGLSLRTLRSYRDALVLYLQDLAAQTGKRAIELDVSDITMERTIAFLSHLEEVRKNGIPTRNAKLAALHTFTRFLSAEHPEHMGELQRILGIPFKRGAQSAPINYLETGEIAAILDCIDKNSSDGLRDYALFSLMYNTGARVQEVLNLRVGDVRLDPPSQVRLQGKGGKIRLCPLWNQTAHLLLKLITTVSSRSEKNPEALLFFNHRGMPLTRFGVRYLLKKYGSLAASKVTTLAEKPLHPHVIRHTTAMHLLKAGVDFATISQWLGHASLNITMRYAKSDLDAKRAALSKAFSAPTGKETNASNGTLVWSNESFMNWMKRL